MPLTAELIQATVRTHKVSLFCASCSKYWAARAQSIPGHACTSVAVPSCGSPLAGGDFHDYDGPITDSERWCFVCGDGSTKVVRAAGKSKSFGVCGAHLPLVLSLQPTMGEAPLLEVHVGRFVLAETLVRRPKPSALVREMMATQEEWDYDDMKRGRG